jgi:hypothetical protein
MLTRLNICWFFHLNGLRIRNMGVQPLNGFGAGLHADFFTFQIFGAVDGAVAFFHQRHQTTGQVGLRKFTTC